MYLGSQGEGNAAKWLDFPVGYSNIAAPPNVGELSGVINATSYVQNEGSGVAQVTIFYGYNGHTYIKDSSDGDEIQVGKRVKTGTEGHGYQQSQTFLLPAGWWIISSGSHLSTMW
jgi:hypothetical protein